MILPDEDSKTSHRQPFKAAVAPRDEAPGSSLAPAPVCTPYDELEAEGQDPLPPYTPREMDPLLLRPGRTRKRKKLGCVSLMCKCLPLLLVSSATCALTWASMHASRRYEHEQTTERVRNAFISLQFTHSSLSARCALQPTAGYGVIARETIRCFMSRPAHPCHPICLPFISLQHLLV
jgi:hypothetical protein